VIAHARHRLGAIVLGASLAVASGAASSQDTPQAARVQAPAPAAAQGIPFKHDKESAPALAGRGIALVALAAFAAYGGALALKRYGLGAAGPLGRARRVRLAESVRLSRRSVLHVVHYRGEELLLAEHDHGLQLMASRPQENDNA